MAFQTNVFRDGQWVTETVDFQAALKVSTATRKAEAPPEERLPCGMLSTIICESPIIRKILPARIRSKDHNDVAFIGDHFVALNEMQPNGQVHQVLRHRNFGARIRNAIVIGSCPDECIGDTCAIGGRLDDEGTGGDHAESHIGQSRYEPLPPQFLVLFLETGEIVTLYSRQVNGQPALHMTRDTPPGRMPFLGTYLAVDPSSRYMAAGCFEEAVVIFELESWEELNDTYVRTGVFGSLFRMIRFRHLRGTIHDVQFLHPRPQDDYHIILIVMMSSKSTDPAKAPRREYVVWDWEAGDDIRVVLSPSGHKQQLPSFHEFPLFIIPLKAQNAFFIVYEKSTAIVKDCLSSAEYNFSFIDVPSASKYHHGAETPIWTTWTRPFRRKDYFETTDIIYLAREDGVVLYIEIDSTTLVHSNLELGCLGTNIATAFSTAYDKFSDLLVVGGESGPGGIWKLAPRRELDQTCVLDDWSPVVDITTTNENSSWVAAEPSSRSGIISQLPRRPDRVFFASGRGAKGSLVEPRVGIRARIGIDLDVGEPVKYAWLFADERTNDGSMYAILALPHSTTVLHFSREFEDVAAEEAETTFFETSSRTLDACQTSSGTIVQISEKSITLVTATQSSRHVLEDTLKIHGITVEKACCSGTSVVVSAQSSHESNLYILLIDQMDIALTKTWPIQGEVSCLSLFSHSDKQFVVVGTLVDEDPVLSVYSLDGLLVVRQPICKTHGEASSWSSSFESLTSLCVVLDTDHAIDIVAGTRCGHLIYITLKDNHLEPVIGRMERLGTTPIEVFPASKLLNEQTSVFATCDQTLIQLSGFSPRRQRFTQRNAVWPTDASDPSLAAPPIHSIFSIGKVDDKLLLLLLGGTKLYLADVEAGVRPVPRTITVGGTPTRIIFSQLWNCVVMAVQVDRKPTLLFLDPDTGGDIAKPVDKDGNKLDFINGLGQPGDRILGLHEWLYIKGGQTFPFIIVTTSGGGLVIASVRRRDRRELEDSQDPDQKLTYWTRYRRKISKEPIYSIIPDEEGLIYCAGRTLYWDVLDLGEKKMKPVKEHELDSPAVSLQVVDGKILALTTMHSLVVVDYKSDLESHDMTLLHVDRTTRTTSHLINVGHTADRSQWPVSLISDTNGGVVGLWLPTGQSSRDLVRVFEGKLYNSVRRFARARCRPAWWAEEQRQPRFGSLRSSTDGAEILGVSLDGTVRHFQFLGLELWRFLYLIQRLVLKAGSEASIEARQTDLKVDMEDDDDHEMLEPENDPSNMHIEGGILKCSLEKHLLENMVRRTDCMKRFCESLDRLEGGTYTNTFQQDGSSGESLDAKYFELAYDILDYILTPVM